MASPAGAQLLLRVNERFVEFLRTQTPAQLQAIADGRLLLTAASPDAAVQKAPVSSTIGATSTTASESSPAGTLNPGEIAARLRGLSSVEEGEAYLAGYNKRLLKISVLEQVAAALGVSGKGKRRDDLIGLVLRQALGARGKYAGLHAG